jgi:hypothetical protein
MAFPRTFTALLLIATLLLSAPVHASTEVAALEARVNDLEAKVLRLEALLAKQHVEVEQAIEDAAGRTTMYDETRVKMGGYVKMDAMLSDSSHAPIRGVGEDLFIPGTITTSGEPADPRLNFHAKETRFWLKSFTPTKRGNATTHFEIDFLLGQQGNERVGNSFSARIRHASMTWDRWTLGQTWTNFFNVASLPDYLDFIGPVGTTFARQAQIRYTVPLASGNWTISLENPETTLTPFGGGDRIDADDSTFPDLVIRRNWSGSWGSFSAAAMARELKIDNTGYDATATGAALGLAGRFKIGGFDDLRWQVNYGNALGRYLGLNAFNAGALDEDGRIELTTQYGAFAVYRHAWNERLHSSFGASFAHADNDVAISGFDVAKSYQSAHADLVWKPGSRITLGAELIWGRREDESGADGMLQRLQLSARYRY